MEEKDESFYELSGSDKILSLERLLDIELIEWIKAIRNAIEQGKDQEVGLTCSGIAADRIVGIAKSMELIHWDKQKVPDESGKRHDTVIKQNKEAEEFREKFKKFEEEVNKLEVSSSMKLTKKADFKVYEVLKKIHKRTTKRGTVIV